jgi:hypothetical protein
MVTVYLFGAPGATVFWESVAGIKPGMLDLTPPAPPPPDPLPPPEPPPPPPATNMWSTVNGEPEILVKSPLDVNT